MHKLESVLNAEIKILPNFKVKTDRVIPARGTDTGVSETLTGQQQERATVVNVSGPNNKNINIRSIV